MDTGSCTLRDSTADCPYALTCGSLQMSVAYLPLRLFGTAATSLNFFGEAGCITDAGAGAYVWTTDFANCGATVSRDTASSDILIQKTISVAIGGGGAAIDNGGGAFQIFDNGSGKVSVTFTCHYSTHAEVSADMVVHQADWTADVSASGTLTSGLELKYFTDDKYLSAKTNWRIGQTQYGQVYWKVTTLGAQLGFYLKSCSIEDADNGGGTVTIISNSCYSKTVFAQPVGGALTNKFVTRQSRFVYKSFSFSTSGETRQRTVCEVEFCIINGGLP